MIQANMLKRDTHGNLYVDITEDSYLEEDDEELLELEYKNRRTTEHVGYLILNPRTWMTREILND